MKQTITLSKINTHNSTGLAKILSNDKILLKQIGSTQQKVTTKDFLQKTTKWQADTNSESYVILKENSSIGLISLSHKTKDSARIGYWIASNEWNKGYGTQAFNLLVEIAKNHGLKNITSTIDKDNVASLRIWEKAGAIIDKTSEKASATLLLY